MKAFPVLLASLIYIVAVFCTGTTLQKEALPSQRRINIRHKAITPPQKHGLTQILRPPNKMSYDYNLPTQAIQTQQHINFDPNHQTPEGIFCFRGNAQRNAPSRGIIQGRPRRLKLHWSFATAKNTKKTEFGTWGGGSGWTGQPLYIHWQNQRGWKENLYSPFLHQSELHEIIVATLSGHIYILSISCLVAPLALH